MWYIKVYTGPTPKELKFEDELYARVAYGNILSYATFIGLVKLFNEDREIDAAQLPATLAT